MKRFMQILGVNDTEREAWGGIFNMNKENPNDDELMLIHSIKEAKKEKIQSQNKFGSYDLGNFSGDIEWEGYPFEGIIEDLVLFYTE